MMFRRVFVSLSLICLLVGCFHHYPDVKLYRQKMEQQKDVAVRLFDKTIKDSSEQLEKGKMLEFELNEQSEIIFNQDYSFYKSYSVNGVKDQKFELEIKSFVSGNGFKPFVAIPKVTIISAIDSVVLDTPTSMQGIHPDFGPYRMVGKWEGQFPDDGEYHVIVTTDNQILNQKVDKSSAFIYTTAFVGTVGWTFYAHYMGKMEITLI